MLLLLFLLSSMSVSRVIINRMDLLPAQGKVVIKVRASAPLSYRCCTDEKKKKKKRSIA